MKRSFDHPGHLFNGLNGPSSEHSMRFRRLLPAKPRGPVIMYCPVGATNPRLGSSFPLVFPGIPRVQLQRTANLKVEEKHRTEELSADEREQELNDGTSTAARRKHFNIWQRNELEEVFQQNPYPSALGSAYLAEKFATTPQSIKTWFKNQRARRRKKAKAAHSVQQHIQGPSTINSHSAFALSGQRCFQPMEGHFVNIGRGAPGSQVLY